MIYRYSANWYGYLAIERLTSMKSQRKLPLDLRCQTKRSQRQSQISKPSPSPPKRRREKELERAEKSDELSTIGLFDWAIDELTEAKKTAEQQPEDQSRSRSPLPLERRQYTLCSRLQKAIPTTRRCFPRRWIAKNGLLLPADELERDQILGRPTQLDPYQVAGLIRQESVFNPRARSPANAYGLMQLLVPTANSMAKKYVSKTSMVTPTLLYEPPLNIELGTAYMKDQLAKFGRIEYMAVAYNAGPGRVPQWRATLPAEIDEFVEAIPFKETEGYVQGMIRNTAQYRRLYDENGNFRPNVGTRPLRGEIDSKPREQFVSEFPEVVVDDLDNLPFSDGREP